MDQDRDCQVNEFLAELTQLSEKYGLALLACECCDGINIGDFKPEDRGGKYLTEACKYKDGTVGYQNVEWVRPGEKPSFVDKSHSRFSKDGREYDSGKDAPGPGAGENR